MPTEEAHRHHARSRLGRVLGSPWAKLAVAAAIVAGLVYFNRLDWRELRKLGDTWPWVVTAFALMFPPYLIVSYRLQVILRSQRIDVPFRQALSWTMIGSFFDLAMPSSNGGDVIKAGLIARAAGVGRRTHAVMAVAFDRVLGLVGLFLLAAAVGLAGWSMVGDVPGRGLLLAAALGGSFGVLLAFRVLGARRLRNHPRVQAFFTRGRLGPLLGKLAAAFNELRERPRHMAAALALSMTNHVFWCAALFCIARALGNRVELLEGFVVFPIAIFGNVFGVAGGFGVGTAGFDVLLSLSLGIANGALVGLVFQALNAMSKLAGLPFFVASHRMHDAPRPSAS